MQVLLWVTAEVLFLKRCAPLLEYFACVSNFLIQEKKYRALIPGVKIHNFHRGILNKIQCIRVTLEQMAMDLIQRGERLCNQKSM